MNNYLKLFRVKHYIKNFLIFIPMICNRTITLRNMIICLFAFLSFSCLSSVVYIINDIKDVKQDRYHPVKRNRPLASGAISLNKAMFCVIVMFAFAVGFHYFVYHIVRIQLSWLIFILYLLINLLYSFGLKNIAIVDILLLASGFVIRVYYGASVLGIVVSPWLFLTILSGAMFLGIGKRKKELVCSPASRKVLKEYNELYLDKLQYVMLALVFVFYSLWTVQQSSGALVFSVVFVFIIFMRYCLIIDTKEEGDPTTVLFSDKVLMIMCAIYGIYMITVFCL